MLGVMSLGADASEMELTELEVQESLKAKVQNILVGVDLIPSKIEKQKNHFVLK